MAIVFYSSEQIQNGGPTPATNIYYCGAIPTSKSTSWDLKDSNGPVTNDEVVACILMDVPEGTVITLYDSPSASTDDDYTTITVLENIYQFTIESIEEGSTSTMPVQIEYHKKNGLKGKVSYIKVDVP